MLGWAPRDSGAFDIEPGRDQSLIANRCARMETRKLVELTETRQPPRGKRGTEHAGDIAVSSLKVHPHHRAVLSTLRAGHAHLKPVAAMVQLDVSHKSFSGDVVDASRARFFAQMYTILYAIQKGKAPEHKISLVNQGLSFSLAESEGFEPSIRFWRILP